MSTMSTPAYAASLLDAVTRAAAELRAIPPEQASRPLSPGKWSTRQIIGHLVDSASNNHGRFVRGGTPAAPPEPDLPGSGSVTDASASRWMREEWRSKETPSNAVARKALELSSAQIETCLGDVSYGVWDRDRR